MSTNLIKAADDARRILKGFKAFAEVADALEAAGQAELRAEEANKILFDLGPKIDAAKAEVIDAKEQATAIVANGKQHAADCVFIAERKAADVAAAAESQAYRKVNDAQLVLDRALTKVKLLEQDADGVLTKRDTLAKECEALEARLAKAQASVAKLLG